MEEMLYSVVFWCPLRPPTGIDELLESESIGSLMGRVEKGQASGLVQDVDELAGAFGVWGKGAWPRFREESFVIFQYLAGCSETLKEFVKELRLRGFGPYNISYSSGKVRV